MNWSLLKNIARFVWIFAVLTFAVLYVVTKQAEIGQMLTMVSLEALLGAGLFVVAGKFCLVANMRRAASQFFIDFGWGESYRIYNLTQLGKYIPGSIWQFVGRISILRERGIPMRSIRDSLLAEHFWVIASAALLAGLLIFSNRPDFFANWLVDAGFEPKKIGLFSVFGLFAITGGVILLFNQGSLHWLRRFLPPLSLVPLLFLMWLFLGASLWVTLEPFSASMPPLLYVVGIYCFAYVAGFLVPFAPAGLGIREAILVFGLIPFVSADVAIMLAVVNRIIYFFVELAIAALCMNRKS